MGYIPNALDYSQDITRKEESLKQEIKELQGNKKKL